MEVECRGIADDDQIDVIAFEITSYVPYEFIEIADMAEGIIEHSGPRGCGFEEIAACGGHFRAADADEFDVVSALF